MTNSEALDLHIEASDSVVSMRRHGAQIRFCVVGGTVELGVPVATLNADEAEEVGNALLTAAAAVRRESDPRVDAVTQAVMRELGRQISDYQHGEGT